MDVDFARGSSSGSAGVDPRTTHGVGSGVGGSGSNLSGSAICGCQVEQAAMMSFVGGGRGQWAPQISYRYVGSGGDFSMVRPNRSMLLVWAGAGVITLALAIVLLFLLGKGTSGANESLEYDCNGDGQPDCGKWNYLYSRCDNLAYCGRSFELGDWTLGQSCRCRRCHRPSLHGTAFGDPALQQPDGQIFDGIPWGTFRNWGDHIDTCAPWVMPKDDSALQSLLGYARSKDYKVRISGAGHSAGGLVTDGKNNNVLVLSLAEYTAPGEWEFGMHQTPDGSWRATVNAGWTQAHLYAKIRPQGFFLPAQTAGYFFALGGIVANSVHGGSYTAGFVHSYVTRLRVMGFDGRIRIVQGEEEVRYWRNSFGLLGIILGIEIQLERRDRLQMYTVQKQMPRWNAEEFWKFIKNDAEADISPDISAQGGTSGSRASFNGEYLIDFISDPERPTAIVIAQKTNSSVDASFDGAGMPEGIEDKYREIIQKQVTDDWHGKMTWGQAARRDGAPPLQVLGVDLNTIFGSLGWLPVARAMSWATMASIPSMVDELRAKVNDGFWLTQSPDCLLSAYFVEPSKAFEAMDYIRSVYLESLGESDFVFNLPAEFRFTHVSDSAVLQPIPAGLWLNAQPVSFADLAQNDQAWKRDFKRIEDHLTYKLGAKPHMGKVFGFETNSDGVIESFSKRYTCQIYSDEQKTKFQAYRATQDPEGLFATGLGMELLESCL